MRRSAVALLVAVSLAGAASAATVTGTSRADRLTGTTQTDLLDGRAGNDTLLALGGHDLLIGGSGRDMLDAGLGDDRVPAHADGVRDRVLCGRGRDIVTADLADSVAADCEVLSRQVSADRTTDAPGQHGTEVEPDTFAFGSTVVSVFQVGRTFRGGAGAIGFATSRDAGRTWRSGLLPGVTSSSPQPGVAELASDPVVAYDAAHRVWLAATLGISSGTSSFHLYVSRSASGLAWSAPVSAVQGPSEGLDKEWIVCDNGPSSPYRGRCYISYVRTEPWQILTVSSSDGGLTWGAPVPTSPIARGGLSYQGAQPVVQPNGALVVVYGSYAQRSSSENAIVASRSVDGGASFAPPVPAAPVSTASIPDVRTFSLPTVEADGSGRIYAAWEGCSGAGGCSVSRVVLTSSADGVTWNAATPVTTGPAGVDHFLPGLGADPSASGRLALVYHAIPDGCANDPACPGIEVFFKTSANGGRTWSRAQRLTAEPVALDWIARTRSGRMLGDYVSTSFVRGRPVAAFSLAAKRTGATFRQAIFAHRPAG